MNRRAKVELFEQIRREYEFGAGTVSGVARKYGVHRRMVRQAISDALPPDRKQPKRERPVLAPVVKFIDAVLVSDKRMPRDRRQASLFVSDDYFSLFMPHGESYRMVIS